MAYEQDPIRDLEQRRRELQDRWFVHKGSRAREGVKSAAWLTVGVVGVAADVALLGGLGTLMAGVAGVGFFSYHKEVKRLEKELKEIDNSIKLLKTERENAPSEPSLANKPSVTAEFSPAAMRKIDALQGRLDALEKSMDKLGANKPKPAAP